MEKTGTSIFEKLYNSFSFSVQPNNFKDELKTKLIEIIDELNECVDGNLQLIENQIYSNSCYPFLYGDPDFSIFSEKGKPLFAIKCKVISSLKEFTKHVYISKKGDYKIRKSSEYYSQIQNYLNILLIPSGLLIIKHNLVSYIFKIRFKRLPSDAIKSLVNFYLFYLLPFLILNRLPKMVNGKLQFFDENEIRVIKQKLPILNSIDSLSKFDLLENHSFKVKNHDR